MNYIYLISYKRLQNSGTSIFLAIFTKSQRLSPQIPYLRAFFFFSNLKTLIDSSRTRLPHIYVYALWQANTFLLLYKCVCHLQYFLSNTNTFLVPVCFSSILTLAQLWCTHSRSQALYLYSSPCRTRRDFWSSQVRKKIYSQID